jgi:beta-lactamase class A
LIKKDGTMNRNNLPATSSIPAPTPQIAKSLSPQQLDAHRAKIAFEVKVVLSAYFQPHEDERIKAAQLAWWCDELEDWTQEQIVWTLRQWNRENARLRPTPGDIVALLKRKRGETIAAQSRVMQPDPSPRHSEEQMAEMRDHMAQAGTDTLAKMRAMMGGEKK